MSTNTKKKKKKTTGRIFIGILVLAIVAAGVFYFTQDQSTAAAETYTGYTVTTGSISNAVSLTGTFASKYSTTYTASSAATVKNVYVAAGQDVKEGDRLLRLSTGETIKAEFDGRVNSLYVAAEDSVASGASLIQVADFENLTVSVQIDEYDIAKVTVGMPCLVTATATSQMVPCEIGAISYIASSSTGSVAYYTATIDVDAPQGVYPGMQASVVIVQEEAQNAVILKQSALQFDLNNQAYVLMDNAAGEKVKVEVTVGVSNGNYVQIVSGLSQGDVVYAKDSGDTTSAANMGMGFNMGMMGGGGAERMERPSGDFGGAGNIPAGIGAPNGN